MDKEVQLDRVEEKTVEMSNGCIDKVDLIASAERERLEHALRQPTQSSQRR